MYVVVEDARMRHVGWCACRCVIVCEWRRDWRVVSC